MFAPHNRIFCEMALGADSPGNMASGTVRCIEDFQKTSWVVCRVQQRSVFASFVTHVSSTRICKGFLQMLKKRCLHEACEPSVSDTVLRQQSVKAGIDSTQCVPLHDLHPKCSRLSTLHQLQAIEWCKFLSVPVLCCKPERCGFDTRWDEWIS
jgi:hypothetical protein